MKKAITLLTLIEWQTRANTINCPGSSIILHLYDFHQSNLVGVGNSHVLRRSAGASRPLVTRSNIGITGTSWGAQLVIKAHMSSVHLCLEARKENKWSKQRLFPWAPTCCKWGSMGCWFISMLGSSMLPSPANKWIIQYQWKEDWKEEQKEFSTGLFCASL